MYFQDVKHFTFLDVQKRAEEHPTKYEVSCGALPDEEFFVLLGVQISFAGLTKDGVTTIKSHRSIL